MEFIWKPDFLTGIQQENPKGIFAHKLINHYNPPGRWDLGNSWPYLHLYQTDLRNRPEMYASQIESFSEDHAQAYRHNHSLFMYGEDFSHVIANMSYEAMDQIISYAKTRWPTTHIKYSTVTEYLK